MLNFNKLRFIVYEIFDNSHLFLTDPRIAELKLSLPFWIMEGRMWRCKYVRLAELPFLYFL